MIFELLRFGNVSTFQKIGRHTACGLGLHRGRRETIAASVVHDQVDGLAIAV
ncbi:hypothetical protein K3758_07560 [Sulfitobacter sp. W002]|uniref:hypothetical protein n=1 Tax=Sulfitobacter sp. W002 TaxID=2867024 RepID=UPI0021A6D9E0|nr:hypothetical protein [Sulfitobacter sp. W002]UWR31351.1 hypothetical protein K3758_07560 [Sulfitobacter sp. W002]